MERPRLSLLARDFVGFRGALTRQVAQVGADVGVTWLGLHELEEAVLRGTACEDGSADVVLVPTDWLPELVSRQLLTALDPHLEARPPQDWPDGWVPSLRGLQRGPDGRTYGLAYHDGPEMLLYRTDLYGDDAERDGFARRHGYPLLPPTTWDQLLDHARWFARPDEGLHGTVQAGRPDGHNNVYDFMLQVHTRGGVVCGPDLEPLFAGPEGEAGLALLALLHAEPGLVDPRAKDWDSVESGEHFAAGEAALMVNWAGFAALSSLPGSPTAGRVGCAPVPRGDGPGGRHGALNVYWVLAVTAGSARPDQAYELLRELASPELDRITSEEGATGTRLSTWRDPAVQSIAPYYAALEAAHEHAISPPSDPRWPAVVRILSDAVDDALRGRATPGAALERAAVRVDSEVRSA